MRTSVCVVCLPIVVAAAVGLRAFQAGPLTPTSKENRMATFSSVTPNLVVADIARSVAFYRDVLGFTLGKTVPDKPPYVFALMEHGKVTVFLNDLAEARRHPGPELRFGNTASIFFVVDDIQTLYDAVKSKTPILMPLTKQFYGMTEFSIVDPDGYVIIVAQPTA